MENKHTLYIKLSHFKKKCYIGTNSKNKTDNILVNIFYFFPGQNIPNMDWNYKTDTHFWFGW